MSYCSLDAFEIKNYNKLPRFLYETDLSDEAITLYTILLNKLELSYQNNFIDKRTNELICYYKNNEILAIRPRWTLYKLQKAKKELIEHCLIKTELNEYSNVNKYYLTEINEDFFKIQNLHELFEKNPKSEKQKSENKSKIKKSAKKNNLISLKFDENYENNLKNEEQNLIKNLESFNINYQIDLTDKLNNLSQNLVLNDTNYQLNTEKNQENLNDLKNKNFLDNSVKDLSNDVFLGLLKTQHTIHKNLKGMYKFQHTIKEIKPISKNRKFKTPPLFLRARVHAREILQTSLTSKTIFKPVSENFKKSVNEISQLEAKELNQSLETNQTLDATKEIIKSHEELNQAQEVQSINQDLNSREALQELKDVTGLEVKGKFFEYEKTFYEVMQGKKNSTINAMIKVYHELKEFENDFSNFDDYKDYRKKITDKRSQGYFKYVDMKYYQGFDYGYNLLSEVDYYAIKKLLNLNFDKEQEVKTSEVISDLDFYLNYKPEVVKELEALENETNENQECHLNEQTQPKAINPPYEFQMLIKQPVFNLNDEYIKNLEISINEYRKTHSNAISYEEFISKCKAKAYSYANYWEVYKHWSREKEIKELNEDDKQCLKEIGMTMQEAREFFKIGCRS